MTTNKDLNFLTSFGWRLRFVALMLVLGNIPSLTMAKSNATISAKKTISATTPAEPKEEEDNLSICRISPNNLRMDLRGSLIFNQKIYLITRDWLVYELPIANLHDSQMMINVTAKPIAQIWPALESPDSKFPKIKSNVEIIFGFNNDEKPELLFLARNEVGVLLNLQTGSLVHRYTVVFPPQECALLSNLVNDFHSISSNVSVHDHIYFQPWKVELYPGTNEIKTMEPIKQYNYAFVDIGRRQIMTEQKKDFDRVPNDYRTFNGTVMNGFIWNGYVHLFGVDTVYIFDVTALTTNGYPVELKILDSSKYWSCELVYKADKKKIGMAVGIIVAIILIIVGVVLCCLLLVKRDGAKNKQNKETSKRSQAKQNEQKASYKSAAARSGISGSGKKTGGGGGANNLAVATSAVPGGSTGGGGTGSASVCHQPICATVSNMTAIRSGEKELPGASASVVQASKNVMLTSTMVTAATTSTAVSNTSSVKQKKTIASLPNRSKLISTATPTSQRISTKSSQGPTTSTVQKMAPDEE